MDSIDIVDSAFSLANIPDIMEKTNDVVETITKEIPNPAEITQMTDNSFWLYIGIVFILIAVGMFAYKSYNNRNTKHVQFDDSPVDDCPGGFCTMDKCPR